MASQATPEELEGLPNGWRELEIGARVPIVSIATLRNRHRGAGWEKQEIRHPFACKYDPRKHRIICVEAD